MTVTPFSTEKHIVWTTSAGLVLPNIGPYDMHLVHEHDGWDLQQRKILQLSPDGDYFWIDATGTLRDREEFALVVGCDVDIAAEIYLKRALSGKNHGLIFDYDEVDNCLWLLAHSHAVIRENKFGFDGQRNVYRF